MIQRLFSILIAIFLGGCSSTPEIPEEYQQPKLSETELKKINSLPRLLAQTEIRTPETDCLVYSKPNLYSEQTDTAKAGRNVWTEETGSAWYRVYKNKRYGYISKICFLQ